MPISHRSPLADAVYKQRQKSPARLARVPATASAMPPQWEPEPPPAGGPGRYAPLSGTGKGCDRGMKIKGQRRLSESVAGTVLRGAEIE